MVAPEARDVEEALCPLAAGGARPAAELRVGEQPRERVRERLVVLRGHEQARLALDDDLGDPADGGRR
jgi:hypothetical protein